MEYPTAKFQSKPCSAREGKKPLETFPIFQPLLSSQRTVLPSDRHCASPRHFRVLKITQHWKIKDWWTKFDSPLSHNAHIVKEESSCSFLQISMGQGASPVLLFHFCGLGKLSLALLQRGFTTYFILNSEKDQFKLIQAWDMTPALSYISSIPPDFTGSCDLSHHGKPDLLLGMRWECWQGHLG